MAGARRLARLISALGLLAAAAGLWWLGAVDIRASALAAIWPMLLIGAGAGLPWGLMDGLAMSVAPPERAGMAAGIFSTTRVAGEGIALASVNALLAGLIRHRMEAIDGVSQAAASAQYLNPHASALLPQAYDDAFRWLLHALVVITLAGAAVAAGLLRERPDRRGAGMTGDGAGND